jgi:hypothetical protein
MPQDFRDYFAALVLPPTITAINAFWQINVTPFCLNPPPPFTSPDTHVTLPDQITFNQWPRGMPVDVLWRRGKADPRDVIVALAAKANADAVYAKNLFLPDQGYNSVDNEATWLDLPGYDRWYMIIIFAYHQSPANLSIGEFHWFRTEP